MARSYLKTVVSRFGNVYEEAKQADPLGGVTHREEGSSRHKGDGKIERERLCAFIEEAEPCDPAPVMRAMLGNALVTGVPGVS